jgi:hypothetical protein
VQRIQLITGNRYITELSPPNYRGTLASIPQLLTVFGLCTGYFVCYGSVNIESSLSWRLPFIIQAVTAFIFTASTLLFAPQSPRWLSSCGKHQEALEVWEKLGVMVSEREKTEESGELPKPAQMKDILAVFGRGARKQTGMGVFLMAMQQLSGIDGVLYVRCSTMKLVGSELTASVCTTSFSSRWFKKQHGVLSGEWYISPPHVPHHSASIFACR